MDEDGKVGGLWVEGGGGKVGACGWKTRIWANCVNDITLPLN